MQYLSQIIVWQRLVEHGSQVSFSVSDLADSPCPVTLSPGSIASRRKSYAVPSIRLRNKKKRVFVQRRENRDIRAFGGLVCRRNKSQVPTTKNTLSKVNDIK